MKDKARLCVHVKAVKLVHVKRRDNRTWPLTPLAMGTVGTNTQTMWIPARKFLQVSLMRRQLDEFLHKEDGAQSDEPVVCCSPV